METIKGVSVIVCCYNSARLLPPTLQQLALQKNISGIPVEVIIVNNTSKDNTTEVAAAEWRKYDTAGIGFTVVDQPIPGLNQAREMGVKNARYSYVIFCDDDNWLCDEYISTAYRIMESNPAIGVLGGEGMAVSDVEIPGWFEKVKSHYAVGRQAAQSGDISNRRYVWGAAMVLRKEVLTDVLNSGIKSYLTDRKGGALSSGGDGEICMWFLLKGYRLWYDVSLVYRHFIPAERLTTAYYTKLKAGLESSVKVLDYYNCLLQYKNYRHRYRNNASNSLFTLSQLIFYKLTRKNKNFNRLLFNIFRLYSYNFIPSGTLLATMAKDILPKMGYRFPAFNQ